MPDRRAGPALLCLGLLGLLSALLLPMDDGGGVFSSCPYLSVKGVTDAKGHKLSPKQLAEYDAAKHLPAQRAPSPAASTEAAAATGELKDDDLPLMTERELSRHDGQEPGRPLLLAVGQLVYDVGERGGRAFYGAGGAYAAFAGRACTRGVALPSLEPSDISDDITDFDAAQAKRVAHWIGFFRRKYRRVARLQPAATLGERREILREREHLREVAAEERARAKRVKVEAGGKRNFTAAELALHDGTDPSRKPLLLMAVGGHVLDVTPSASFYGVGRPRHVYAGKAVTRALTLQSVEEKDLNDFVDDFSVAKKVIMQQRVSWFLSKFVKVGDLVPAATSDSTA